MFLFQNARRDKAVRDGTVEYDEMATALEDLSDWKNPAFRYITVSTNIDTLNLWNTDTFG